MKKVAVALLLIFFQTNAQMLKPKQFTPKELFALVHQKDQIENEQMQHKQLKFDRTILQPLAQYDAVRTGLSLSFFDIKTQWQFALNGEPFIKMTTHIRPGTYYWSKENDHIIEYVEKGNEPIQFRATVPLDYTKSSVTFPTSCLHYISKYWKERYIECVKKYGKCIAQTLHAINKLTLQELTLIKLLQLNPHHKRTPHMKAFDSDIKLLIPGRNPFVIAWNTLRKCCSKK